MSKKKTVRKQPKTPPKPNLWRRVLLGLAGLAALLVLAVVALFVYAAIARSRPVSLPAPTGPYAVGRTEYAWTDPARNEIFSDQQGQHREISAWIWYPAQPGSGQPAVYLPAEWARLRNADRGILATFFQDLNQVKSHALEKAAVASSPHPFPVIVFSTGYGGIAPEYATLEEDLASRGYVVVGLTNPYSAPEVVFPDGQVILRSTAGSIDESSQAATQDSAAKLVAVWSLDIRFALDQMQTLNADKSSPLAGKLDLNKVGLAGHSLGGAVSAQACANDARCKAAADVDGTLYGDPAQFGIGPPLLLVSSEPGQGQPVEDPSYAASLKHGAQGVEIRGAYHFNFQDVAVTFQPFLHLLGYVGPIDGTQGLQATRDLLAAFFGQTLAGQPAGLDTVLQQYPGVLVRYK